MTQVAGQLRQKIKNSMGPGMSKTPGDGIPDLDELQHANALEQLLTADQEELLDLIDKFREYGLNHTVDLPQLVVCGNQSCGKSSVLEAISQLTFPRGETLCTTFATELVLRRGPPKVSVKIRASNSSEPGNDFQPSGAIENFGSMIDEAKSYLLDQHPELGESSFLEETLQIEVYNPRWPPLTLVDLPGLIQSANRNQTQNDVRLVHSMVRKYMANPKTIILAVVSAQDDPANQKVLKMATEADPAGVRTLGIITKPDKAGRGSKREEEFITFAQNKAGKYKFDLGWHVVRNRDFNEEGLSLADLEDKQFGLESKWREALDETQLGVDALRTRLSQILYKHIRASLPSVLRNIKEKLTTCQNRLDSIGPPRSTPSEHQNYLIPISTNFQQLVKDAVTGDLYSSAFFLKSGSHTDQVRLRAFVEKQNRLFADLMYERGHSWAVKDCEDYPEWPIAENSVSYGLRTLPAPKGITAQDYVAQIKKILGQNPSKLPTTFDPRLVTPIFREQSERWRAIAEAHIETVFSAATILLVDAVREVTNDYTSRALQENLISRFLVGKKAELDSRLVQVLKPFRELHVAIYTRGFETEVLARRKARCSTEQVKELAQEVESWRERSEPNSDTFRLANYTHGVVSKLPTAPPAFASTETELLDLTYSYYKVNSFILDPSFSNAMQIALGIFVENVIMLVVESCLMFDLHEAFSPRAVSAMTESNPRLLAALASEPENITQERIRLEARKTELTKALETCWMKVEGLPTVSEPKPDITISPPQSNNGDQEESDIEGDALPSQSSTPRSNVHSRASSIAGDSTPATTPGSQASNPIRERASKGKSRLASSSDGLELGSSETTGNFQSGFLEDGRRSPTPKDRGTSRSRLARVYGRQARSSQGSIGAFPLDAELDNN